MRISTILVATTFALASALFSFDVAESQTVPLPNSAFRIPHSAFEVKEQKVTPSFPDEVLFTLKTSGFVAERAELNFQLVGESVTSGLSADISEATDNIETDVTLDLRTSYIPPGAEVTYYWQLTAPDGTTVDTPTQSFQMEDEGFAWRTRTDDRDRVTVHWYDGNNSFGEQLLATATDALDRLEEQIGAGIGRKAEIWIYANSDDLFYALPLHQPEWVGGQAYPLLAVVMAAIPNDEFSDLEIKRVIPHEISHLVLYQATRNPYNGPPAWLDEGLAVHNQEVPYPGGEETLREAAEGGWLVPLKALGGSFGADGEEALLAYEQSGSVVDFILNDSRYGPDKLARMVAEFKKGVTYDDALNAGLGINTEALDAQWRDSLPYNVAPPGSGTRPVRSQNNVPAWLEPLLFIGLGALVTLFIVGGVITLIVLARRGTGRRT